MVNWWNGLGYKRRFYPNKLKGTPEDQLENRKI